MAVHSITHREDADSYWTEGTTDTWAREMSGVRLIMERSGIAGTFIAMTT
jgi:hypothetical protein